MENGDRNLEIGTSKLELGPHGARLPPQAMAGGLDAFPCRLGRGAQTQVCEGRFYPAGQGGGWPRAPVYVEIGGYILVEI